MTQERDTWPPGTIFTVGHSTLPIERFLALLGAYAIARLVDVRTVPRSRHNPQFNADALAASLATAHIAYAAMPALGGVMNSPIRVGATRAFAALPTICRQQRSVRPSRS